MAITKRRILFSVITALVLFGCMDNGVQSTEDLAIIQTRSTSSAGTAATTAAIAAFDQDAFRSAIVPRIITNFTSTDQYAFKSNQYAYFNYDRAIRDQSTAMNQIFRMPDFNPVTFADEFNLNESPPSDFLPSQYNGVRAAFSTAQLTLLNDYVQNMYNIHSASEAQRCYNTAAGKTGASTLSEADKVELLSVIEVMNQYAMGYYDGGFARIHNDLRARGVVSLPSQPMPDCNDPWRLLWPGAVRGGVVGAIRGASLAFGKTQLRLPGYPTAPASVCGSVFGFATGFIESAHTCTTTVLIEYCYLKVQVPLNFTDPTLGQPKDFVPVYCGSGCNTDLNDRKTLFRD